MRDWKQILAAADEEYLIGLSNKGTVKRAHKDMETVKAQVLCVEDEAQVAVGEMTVTIRSPLPESGCSCPSVSICRHVVQAIFLLQKELTDGEPAAEKRADDTQKQTAAAGQADDTQEQTAAAGQTDDTQKQTAAAGQADDKPERAPQKVEPAGTPLWQEIRDFPVQKARRAMGARAFEQFVSQIRKGIMPDIRESSVITLTLPGGAHTVKLLSPLAYSSCTCHKKELCSHKAAAILWCQYRAGAFTREEMEREAAGQPEFDMAGVREAAEGMKYFLEGLMDTGLARAAQDILQDMERMAIISHNAGLARLEGSFRALASLCDRYFKRAASFRIGEFLQRMMALYEDVCRILAADDPQEIASLAGSFRAAYGEMGELHLTGITMEQFESESGYAGETIYFLEETKGEWYTYTNARPIFYEDGGKRRGGAHSRMPWELNGTLSDLASCRICLKGARADERRRLSSSKEAKGERMGMRVLTEELLKDWYYEDFFRLFRERIPVQGRCDEEAGEEETQAREPVFIRPSAMGEAGFSDAGQLFSLPLLDRRGRELIVEVAYSRREAETIRYLERLVARWKDTAARETGEAEEKLPCFLGRVFLQNGRIRMYPLALFQEKELPALTDEGREGESGRGPDTGSIAAVKAVLEEAAARMEDLCQSGLDTVHDSTLEAMERLRESSGKLGLAGLSRRLATLGEGIGRRRHQVSRAADGMSQVYADSNRYLMLGRERILWDEANEYYRGGKEL